MRNRHVMLYDMTMTSVNLQSMCILPRITILVASMASEFKFDLRFEISNLNYLVSLCMLPLTALLEASEAMAASKQPQRSHLTS